MFRQVDAILKELLEPLRPAEESPEAPFSVLVAVSGGIDSMCLSDVMYRLGRVPFAIAHCNFGLRGEESDRDEHFVKGWARKRKIPFHCIHFKTQEFAERHGVSTEMAARELRYRWFRDLCKQKGYRAVLVAHNANDRAETLLLNLLRGTGIKGLTGMPLTGTLPVKGGEGIPLLRPLLRTGREHIAAYVQGNGVPYREDRTNAEDIYRRNRIRNEVFPVLRDINPSFIPTLCEDMDRLREVDAIADDFYAVERQRLWDGESIDIDALRATPHWEYILFRILTENGFTPGEARLAEDLLKGQRHISGTTIGGGEKVLYFAFGRMIVSEPRDFWDEEKAVEVTGPGVYSIGKLRVEVSEEHWDPQTGQTRLPEGSRCLIADAAALPFPFRLRSWRHGDYLRPLGLHGRKKVQDLFQDLRLSLEQKHDTLLVVRPDAVPTVADPGFKARVSAVLPYRIDEKLRITRDTVRILRITLL